MDSLALRLPVPAWTASLARLEFRGGFPHSVGDRNSYLVAITAQCPLLVHLHLDLSWMSMPSGRQFHIPSLKVLHISVYQTRGDSSYLLRTIDLFDTPALTEFIINGAHRDQIFVLFNSTSLPHSSFPALTSLSFVHRGSCGCDQVILHSETISAPPLQLFPALSSLTLINQCYTVDIVHDILGPASQPWPLLQTVALQPNKDNLKGLRATLRDAVYSKRQGGLALPKFRLSPKLLSSEDWKEMGADVELFGDAADVLDGFRTS
jgi:hypothetical protein